MQLNCSYYGQQIVTAGCSNTPSDKVSLFKFPKDAGLKKSEKSKFNEKSPVYGRPLITPSFCSEHFTDDSFEINSALTWPEEKKALKPENVPTIFHQSPQTDHEIGHKRRAKGVASEEEEL